MRHRRGFAATAGRWSAQHRWAAVGVWLLLVVVALGIGSAVKPADLTPAEQADGAARQAQQILDDAGFDLPAGEVVFVHSDTEKAGSAGFERAVGQAMRAVRATGRTTHVTAPSARHGTVSADGHSALVTFEMKGQAASASKRVGPVLHAVSKVAHRNSGMTVQEFGEASFNKEYNDKLATDYTDAEMYTLPITLGILIIAFGALVAAVLPVVLALTVVIATTGIIALTSHLLHVDQNAMSVMTLIGIAVGIDYSLFYIRRTREERARGAETRAAVEAAAATSGRSVIVSGLAVMAAMAGMFLSGNGIQMGMAEATIIVVAVAVVGSVTVLPALLSLLGGRIEKGRVPLLRRGRTDGRLVAAVVAAVLRRPLVATVLAVAALGALIAPAFSLHLAEPGFADLPTNSIPALRTYSKIQHAFPGTSSQAKIVVKADDVTTASTSSPVAAFKRAVSQSPELTEPVTVQRDPAHGILLVTAGLAGNGTGRRSLHALHSLRDRVLPGTLGRIDGATVKVAGMTAASADTTARLADAAPRVIIFVLVLTFVIMLLAFRSVTVAGLTLVLNMLSVGAAYGLIVLIFQKGYGDHLLGFTSSGGITSWVPLLLFVVLFGLSMDYHVFVVSRIREVRDRGNSTIVSTEQGVRHTAGVVTSAAIVMAVVAAVFGTLPQVSMKEAGVGLAAAVLIDATIIRVVLLPAALRLLGESAWYLPRWLRFIDRHPVVDDAGDAEPGRPSPVVTTRS